MALHFNAQNFPLPSIPSGGQPSLSWPPIPLPDNDSFISRSDVEKAESALPESVRNSVEYRVAQYNNAVARQEAQLNREWNQSSAREAMDFDSDQAELAFRRSQSSAREAMAFEANEAQIQRDWIEQQRSTAYQTAVDDLRAAGLNPALAYMNGGASTVSGSSASGFSTTGSSARGISSSGSAGPVDMRSVIDMMQTTATNANSKQIAIMNGLFSLGKELIGTIGYVASATIRGPSKGLNISQNNYNG